VKEKRSKRESKPLTKKLIIERWYHEKNL